jgi:hypothetical protein
MSAKGVWLGNAAWPNNKSCGQFAKDVFRLAEARTDKQKALAFYDWMQRCMMRGANLQTPDGAGGYSRNFDPLVLLTSWGFGECTFWGWVATECLCAAGLKARRVVVHKQGHTYYEVWYKGDDGAEQWHAFDPYIGWYFLNESGEVASCAQLASNPQLVQNPLPGHPVPLGSHPERSGLGHRHRTEDQVIIDQPLRLEENSWDLRRGMEVTFNFLPEVPHKALFTRHPAIGEQPVDNRPDGTHDDICEISRLGFRQYARHIPYWKNYMWPTPNKDLRNEGQPVRWHGAGALRWKPLLYGAEPAVDARNAVFQNGSLKATGQHHFCEVMYHVRLPYLISWLDVDYDVAGAGGDVFSLHVSADDRRTWWPLKTAGSGPHWGQATNGQAEWKNREPSVQGLKEFWLRLTMLSHSPVPTLAVQALNIAVGFQHNMHIQPRLVPGANPLWVEAGQLGDGAKLQAEWIYQIDGEEKRTGIELAKTGRSEETVKLDAGCPSKIWMTGIRLACK